MKTITIPEGFHPLEININGLRYSYMEGETVTVKDDVAALIEQYIASVPVPRPNSLIDNLGLAYQRSDKGKALKVKEDGSDVEWGTVEPGGGGGGSDDPYPGYDVVIKVYANSVSGVINPSESPILIKGDYDTALDRVDDNKPISILIYSIFDSDGMYGSVVLYGPENLIIGIVEDIDSVERFHIVPFVPDDYWPDGGYWISWDETLGLSWNRSME